MAKSTEKEYLIFCLSYARKPQKRHAFFQLVWAMQKKKRKRTERIKSIQWILLANGPASGLDKK